MITADTITDEQIRELWSEARARFDRKTLKLCKLAYGNDWMLFPTTRVARARLAEILNARAEKG